MPAARQTARSTLPNLFHHVFQAQRPGPDLSERICVPPEHLTSSLFPIDIYCTTCNSTRVLPFHVSFRPGGTIYEQVVYAATKAMISGQLRPGDPFPSVRTLSKELKINPNTAHKVITHLLSTGLLENRAGFATVVAKRPLATKAERTKLLEQQFEELVVEGKRLGIALDDMEEALEKHWKRLEGR
jgi:GntR family transcriptional regulator